jgi:hypothetical protein
VRSITDDELDSIFKDGYERARQVARPTLDEVKARMGLRGANG